jgi:uncharacterized YigZ family protein
LITSYTTISAISEGEYKEKGSKFLAFAHPIESIEEAKELIKEYKKQYYDARHHCFAYCINPSNEQTRAADDGEPNNSAGAPILGQIRSFDLCNVMVVVVRYFGGTKLGVSGLITAYRSAAFEALNNAEKIELQIKEVLTIRFDYVDMDKVMKIIKQFDLEIVKQKMELECNFTIKVTLSDLDAVKVALESWLFEE